MGSRQKRRVIPTHALNALLKIFRGENLGSNLGDPRPVWIGKRIDNGVRRMGVVKKNQKAAPREVRYQLLIIIIRKLAFDNLLKSLEAGSHRPRVAKRRDAILGTRRCCLLLPTLFLSTMVPPPDTVILPIKQVSKGLRCANNRKEGS